MPSDAIAIAGTFLNIDIAGAGLILVIFPLFLSMKEKIFENRIKEINEAKANLVKLEKNVEEKDSMNISLKERKALLNILKDRSQLPEYLKLSFYISFFAFIVSSLSSIFLMFATDYGVQFFLFPTVVSAILGIIGFAVCGFGMYADIMRSLKNEYTQLLQSDD